MRRLGNRDSVVLNPVNRLREVERASANGRHRPMSEHETVRMARLRLALQWALPIALLGGLYLLARAVDSGLASLTGAVQSHSEALWQAQRQASPPQSSPIQGR